MLAVKALTLLSTNLLRACGNGNDLAAREAMLLGAMLAGQAFANSPVAAVHALAYPIGGIFHVPHEIGRASLRERVCQYGSISVVAVALKKKKIKQTYNR